MLTKNFLLSLINPFGMIFLGNVYLFTEEINCVGGNLSFSEKSRSYFTSCENHLTKLIMIIFKLIWKSFSFLFHAIKYTLVTTDHL